MLWHTIISGLAEHHLRPVLLLCSWLLLSQWHCGMWRRSAQHQSSSGDNFRERLHFKALIENQSQARMKIHSAGCLTVISQHMAENITSLVATIVGTLFVQVKSVSYNSVKANYDKWWHFLQFVGLVLSFCLANSIKKECEVVWISEFWVNVHSPLSETQNVKIFSRDTTDTANCELKYIIWKFWKLYRLKMVPKTLNCADGYLKKAPPQMSFEQS